jgi:hypothetical protein
MAKRNAQLEAEMLDGAAAQMEASEVSPDDLMAADEAEDAQAAVPVVGGPINLTFAQLKELLGANQGLSAEALVDMATKAAMAGADRIKPKELSTTQVARKSAFNPDGDRDHPRPKLKCHMYFGSAPLGSPKEVTTLTHAEIVALNGLTPGHYRIRKMDGTRMVVEVKGQMNSNRQLDRLWILLPEGDDQKNLYPPMADFASQCVEANRVQPEMVA